MVYSPQDWFKVTMKQITQTTRPLPTVGALLATLILALPPGQQLGAQSSPPQQQPPFFLQIPPPPSAPPVGSPDEAGVPEDPYWQETVARAVEQFASDNPDVRRSAVMLLGKYPVPPAREVVGRALQDPHPSVRQAALVSLLEEQGQMNPALAEPALRLLADPDVSIRRIASNSIRTVVYSFPFTLRPGLGQVQRQLSSEAERILQAAFADPDVSVRQNMVTNFPLLQISLPEKTVVDLLHDPDQEVAVNALRWGLNLLTPGTLHRELETMAQHPSPIFRLELARALQSRPSPASLLVWSQLQQDPHPPVAIEAMLGLFNQQPDQALYQRMMDLFRQQGRRSDAGPRLILAVQMLDDSSEPFLREWMEETDPALRQQAVQVYLSRFRGRIDRELLFSLLNDTIPGIRQQAVRTLIQSNLSLTDHEIRQAVTNRHPDVRQAAAGLAALLPPARAEDLLLDLLLDEVRQVRQAALQQIGLRQIDGWEEIMSISLRVDDPIIQRTALDWLMRIPTPETLRLLRLYRDETPQSPLRPQIEAHLRRHPNSDPS
jgi:HEAT repeat protein